MIPGDFRLPRRSRKNIALFGALSLFGLGGLVVTIAVTAFVLSAWMGRPLTIFGFDEGPDQPIAFPHTTHVQELGLDCTFCHRNVTMGAAATVPAVGLCMSCHTTAGDGLEGVEQLRSFHAQGTPIDWVRVHRVPDHVHFVHEAHIRFFSGRKLVVKDLKDGTAEIRLAEAKRIDPDYTIGDTIEVLPMNVCSICHGDVGAMTKVKQVRSLKMGDCVDCHKDNSAPTDCVTCHY